MEQGSKSGTCGKCELAARGLLDSNEQVLFHQGASYRGGLQGYPNAAKKNGFAFVFDNSFAFYDNDIAWKIPYERVTEVSLDSFKPSGTRAVLAGVNARMLQEIQNIIALSYLDDDSIERIAKFQIHGALSIPGEAAKAGEFINHLLEFKKKFSSKVANNSSDPAVKLEKLKKLKEQGIISDSEFEAKKRELLDQL
jgi:hypothetical protein